MLLTGEALARRISQGSSATGNRAATTPPAGSSTEDALRERAGALERQVEERTAALTAAVECLRLEMAERQQADELLRRQRDELAHVNRLLMLGEMASAIAHELNQPLASITNYLAACENLLATEPEAAAELRSIMRKAGASALRAGEIVRRWRALLRRGDSRPLRLQVNGAVQDALSLLQHEIALAGAEMDVRLEAELPPVIVDPIQLQQVIVNLVRNAVEAMSAGGGRLSVATGMSPEGDVEVRVGDTGCGLPPGREDSVFDSFFTTKERGLGLGLSISRTLIEAHGGRLWVCPNTARGVTFHFVLPSLPTS